MTKLYKLQYISTNGLEITFLQESKTGFAKVNIPIQDLEVVGKPLPVKVNKNLELELEQLIGGNIIQTQRPRSEYSCANVFMVYHLPYPCFIDSSIEFAQGNWNLVQFFKIPSKYLKNKKTSVVYKE